MDTVLGQVVFSKAGRDAGKRFVVVGIVDSMYVLISDGNLRRIEKPKKKKKKHLELSETVIESIGNRLLTGQKVSNADIRKALAELDGTMNS
ncbi:RNA-binding protein [Clostridium thermosuccinogenes]|uniref:RNA-binding protein n=1 Tax=Clostridium thermosuccinogenes TaxID=84032 RepID=A0A2K2FCS4_9CLOT|nr:KOW domain-containing RNA-binding protein [Pseudoclostridium thermosuccinogenes]AUS98124.1 RNA-binding protein [Pseudoclostridium thermosuccinogenes]PNT95405.1 RNA-binding protein [Pseudoclostridium thermosuccinogenes]PNT96581.1 RNA-binding protein [Pseudoclostridium thermosuccinogenes]